MNKKQRGYIDIQPPIYEVLDWDMDLIIKFLEYYRNRLPDIFPEFKKYAEYDLLVFKNPHGKPYPVIGLHLKSNEVKADFFELEEKVENNLENYSKVDFINCTKGIKAPSWENLKTIKSYPERK